MSLLHDSLYFLLLSTLLFNSCQGILMVYQDPEMFTKEELCVPHVLQEVVDPGLSGRNAPPPSALRNEPSSAQI